jgi:hypothetical protein
MAYIGGEMYAWTRIIAEAKPDLAAIRAGADRDASSQRALSLLDGKSEIADAEAQGALAALLLGRLRDPLIACWLELGGPGFAIACATHERRWIATHPKNGGKIDLGVRWLEPREGDRIPVALDVPTWDALHAAFRKLKKDDKLGAQDVVRTALVGAPASLALWTSGIALLGGEAAAAIGAIDTDARAPLDAWLVAALDALAFEPSDTTRAAAIDVLSGANPAALARIAKHPKDIVRLLGDDGVHVLVDLLALAHTAPVVDATSVKKVAEALATSGAPIAGDFFRRNVGSRLVGTVAAAWVTEHGTDARASEIHAKTVAEKAVRSKRAKKVAAKTSARKKHVEAVTQVREASDEEVPWVLREPPWHEASATPPLPSCEGIDEAPFEEALHLSESDREGIGPDTEVDDDDPVGLLAQRGVAVVPMLLSQPILVALHGLRLVESPRAAARLVLALATPRAAVAKAYFRAYPSASAIGLVRMALDPKSNQRAALEAISLMLEAEHEEHVASAAARYGEDAPRAIIAAARLVGHSLEAPLVPAWARGAKLPPVLAAGGARLPEKAAQYLLEMCTFGRHPGLREIELDRVSTDAFLVVLLDAWVRAGAREDWVLPAVAALGGPDAARAVAQRAKEWNRDRATRDLAIAAVEALGEGGTSAVVALSEVARKGGALGERASEMLASVARREHLSTDELADLAVPTLDLDERGRAVLDFGPRNFEIAIGDDLAPRILDQEGRLVTTTPRQLAADDPVKARASLERLKSLKKSMGEIARNVAARLEMAMITGRTWRAATFRTTLVDHPLLGRLVRRLVWSRGGGRLFRIAEDGSAADERDELVEIAPNETIRIPHTLDISAEAHRAWGDVLSDYEIIQPFPQIGRSTFAPTETELGANALNRFAGAPVKQMAVQGRLLARGWERVADFGVTTAFVRRFRAITAQYTLVDPLGFGEEFVNDTTLGSVTFGVPLDRVPPLIFSEAAYDLHVLADG